MSIAAVALTSYGHPIFIVAVALAMNGHLVIAAVRLVNYVHSISIAVAAFINCSSSISHVSLVIIVVANILAKYARPSCLVHKAVYIFRSD